MRVKVLVAAHKNYEMPTDPMYLPVFVGKDLHPDVNHTFQGDNTGDNISQKNPTYNELTAIYWGWKNLDVDAMGLVHYRRTLELAPPGRFFRFDAVPVGSGNAWPAFAPVWRHFQPVVP